MKKKLPHNKIKHVVVLMLENRGFDHLMGWLYGADERPVIRSGDGDARPFLGLSQISDEQRRLLANPFPAYCPDATPIPPIQGARSPKTPAYRPGEEFAHIMNQVWGVADSSEDDAWTTRDWNQKASRDDRIKKLQKLYKSPPMSGYIRDYAEEFAAKNGGKKLGARDLAEIMETYIPEQLPVLSGLARNFAISDEWFCSVPSQTNTNRAFSIAGTSRGMVNNSFYEPFLKTTPRDPRDLRVILSSSTTKSNADTIPSTRTLFEVLQQHGYSWRMFWQDGWPTNDVSTEKPQQYTQLMFPFLARKEFAQNFVRFDATISNNPLFELLRHGELPAVLWVEPKWGGGPAWSSVKRTVGNDLHPVSDTTAGEDFVRELYLALSSRRAVWEETLLVITFDENGGTYDHIAPPSAEPSGNDASPLPMPAETGMNPTTRTQFGFEFNQFGIRVPTLVISPYVQPCTVFRSNTDVPFDHTSLISTILTLAGVEESRWLLGSRVASAPTFHHILDEQPRPIQPISVLKTPRVIDESKPLLMTYTQYDFEYVGDKWAGQRSPRYLGPEAQDPTGNVMPTLCSGVQDSQPYYFCLPGDENTQGPVQNMALVRVASAERKKRSSRQKYLYVGTSKDQVFLHDSSSPENILWQIRLVSSRDPTDVIREGDYVYLVAHYAPPPATRGSARTTPDPLQRLLPHPASCTTLTTRAGEWALWRVHRRI